MKSKPEKEQLITIPLSILVKYILGEGYWDNRPIDQEIADIILALTENEHTCYIEPADELSPRLQRPMLWNIQAWYVQTEKWLRAKKWSDFERSKRNILEANVKMVSRALKSFCSLEGDIATSSAYSLVKNNKFQQLKAIGINKLYTTEQEIP